MKQSDGLREFEDRLRKTPVPCGSNKTHKEALWEILAKAEKEYPSPGENAPGIFLRLNTPLFKIALVSSIVVIALVLTVAIGLTGGGVRQTTVLARALQGDLFINKEAVQAHGGASVVANDVVSTGKDSRAGLSLGASSITLSAETELAVVENAIRGNAPSHRFALKRGGIFCDVTLPDADSIFEIQTYAASFAVAGTKFHLEVAPQGDVSVRVTEGRVRAGGFFKGPPALPVVKDPELKRALTELFAQTEIIGPERAVLLRQAAVDRLNEDASAMLLEFGAAGDEEILRRRLDALEAASRRLFEADAEAGPVSEEADSTADSAAESPTEPAAQPIIRKLNRFADIELAAVGTGTSASAGSLYITCDSAGSVYSINPADGRMYWKFKFEQPVKITTRAHPCPDGVLVGSPDRLFLLSGSGGLVSTFRLERGIDFWPDFITSDGRIYVPTSQTVLVYFNRSLEPLPRLPVASGQLYVGKQGDRLFSFDLNSQEIHAFDLSRKTSRLLGRLNQRAFMAPLASGAFLFMSDTAGTVYKIDPEGRMKPATLSVGTSAFSLVAHKGGLYCVAGDGYFYAIDGRSFNNARRVARAEMNPDPDAFLTKKPLLAGDDIYFSSDSGKVFCYDTASAAARFLSIANNPGGNPLIASPVKIGDTIYFIDNKATIYTLEKKAGR